MQELHSAHPQVSPFGQSPSFPGGAVHEGAGARRGAQPRPLSPLFSHRIAETDAGDDYCVVCGGTTAEELIYEVCLPGTHRCDLCDRPAGAYSTINGRIFYACSEHSVIDNDAADQAWQDHKDREMQQ